MERYTGPTAVAVEVATAARRKRRLWDDDTIKQVTEWARHVGPSKAAARYNKEHGDDEPLMDSSVRTWLQRDYPAIAARARKEKAKIFWGDETGLRSDDVRGRSYAPRGKTPVVRPNHRRANVGVISAVTNKGELRWMVLDGAINAPLLIDFLARLIRDADGKVFLILDNLRVHRARLVQDWLVGNCSPGGGSVRHGLGGEAAGDGALALARPGG